MSTPAQPSFTPAGPYSAGNVEYGTVLNGNMVAFRITAVGDDEERSDAHQFAKRVATSLNWEKSAPSLYAYAKAEDLRRKWVCSARNTIDDSDANETERLRHEYEQYVVALGWNRKSPDADFLATYRATALAIAEGRNP